MTSAKLKRNIIPITIGIGLVAFSLVFQLSDNPFIEKLRDRMEWIAYDLRLQSTLPQNPIPHENIVVIDIDDKSLAAEGRWPWPRERIARLTEKLTEAGVIVTVYDILFSEPEANVAISVLDILADFKVDELVTNTLINLADQIDGDITLATSLQDKDIVLGYAFIGDEEEYGAIGLPLNITNIEELSNTSVRKQPGFLSNLDILQGVANNGGFLSVDPDADGVIRRANLVYEYKGQFYPSLSLEAVRLFYASESATIQTAKIADFDVMEYLSLDVVDIPTDGIGAVLVPYRGPSFSFTYFSATDILNDAVEPEKLAKLESTIAFIGATATGLNDLKSTPVSKIFPGVEVHASIAAGIIDSANTVGETAEGALLQPVTFPTEPEWAQGLNFVITLVIGLTLAILLPFMAPLPSILLFTGSAGSLLGFNIWLWTEYNFVMAVASPLSTIFLLAMSNLAYGFIFESQGKKHLRDQFGQYIPPALVDQMLDSDDDLGFEGDRREMTVLFADIRSFTTISESLTPTQLKDMLNRFFTPMTEIIFNKNGTIDKYVGDMIMAFWGAPLQDPDHAKHAIDGALAMLEKVEAMKPEMDALGYPPINLGIGLNTGFMNVGNMGSEFRRAYTVLGDAVNLSSRLESLTKQYGVKLIVGENTREGQDDYIFRRLDKVQVKGKTEPVVIFEPICLVDDATDSLLADLETHEQALEFYYAREWTEAKKLFTQLKENDPDRMIYSIYLDRMSSMNELLLTDDWDGTFEHTSK